MTWLFSLSLWAMWAMTIEDFHVTSYHYQANFVSHHPVKVMLVSFLHRLILENTAKCQRIFYLVHSDKNISTHTYVKFKILFWSKSKVTVCLVVFSHIALYKKETNERGKIMHVKVRTPSYKPSIVHYRSMSLVEWNFGHLIKFNLKDLLVARLYFQEINVQQ